MCNSRGFYDPVPVFRNTAGQGPGKSKTPEPRWSDRENRFISVHRTDGYELIAEGLRAMGGRRTPDAVKVHARRSLGIRLKRWPEDGRRRCVKCGTWFARPNHAGGRQGFCPTCWQLMKNDAFREANAELEAKRAYQRERKYKRTHIDR